MSQLISSVLIALVGILTIEAALFVVVRYWLPVLSGLIFTAGSYDRMQGWDSVLGYLALISFKALGATLLVLLPIGAAILLYHRSQYVAAIVLCVVIIAICIPFVIPTWHRILRLDQVPAGADLTTLQPIDGSSTYSRDKNAIYCNGKVLPGADPNSFLVLRGNTGNYAKDASRVFSGNGCAAISDVDPATFETIGTYGYARDKSRVWWFGKIVAGADPESFQEVETEFGPGGRDKEHTYRATSALD